MSCVLGVSAVIHVRKWLAHCQYIVTGWDAKLDQLSLFLFLLCISSYISGVHHCWVRFLCVWQFFLQSNQRCSHILSSCMQGVFLLLAFTYLGHEYQDLSSLWDGMHVCTDYTSVYSLIRKSFREWSQNPCSLQGKNPLYQKPRGGLNLHHCIMQDSEPNTLPTELLLYFNMAAHKIVEADLSQRHTLLVSWLSRSKENNKPVQYNVLPQVHHEQCVMHYFWNRLQKWCLLM